MTGVRRSALRKPGNAAKQLAPRLRSFTGAPSPLGNAASAAPVAAAGSRAAATGADARSTPPAAADAGSMAAAAAPAASECAADGALDVARLQARTRTPRLSCLLSRPAVRAYHCGTSCEQRTGLFPVQPRGLGCDRPRGPAAGAPSADGAPNAVNKAAARGQTLRNSNPDHPAVARWPLADGCMAWLPAPAYPTLLLTIATAQLLLAEKDAALAALAQRLARLEAGQGARAQLQALDAQSARLRVLPPSLNCYDAAGYRPVSCAAVHSCSKACSCAALKHP